MSIDTIGVVIPVRNGARYLPEALASLHEQERVPDEVVVVDDGSTDDSGDIARAAGAQVIRIESLGIGAARNIGAEVLSTTMITFLDADDRFPPDRLARQEQALQADPELDGVVGHMREFLTPDRVEELRGRFAVAPNPMPGWHASGMLLRRPAFDRSGGFDADPELHDAFNWVLRMRELGLRLVLRDDVVVERRIHGDNTTLTDRSSLHARYLRSARIAIQGAAAAAAADPS